MQDDEKLDNPMWHSLNETHNKFAVNYDFLKLYHPDYCAFGGFTKNENIASSLVKYAILADQFYLVGEKPMFLGSFKLKNELVCLQMISYNQISIDISENIVKLGKEYNDELTQLVNLVQPGFFKAKTFLMGNYYGILKDNKLIAVAGERMQMNKYVEVSAVVTHPDYVGKGYAKQLVAYTVNQIIEQDRIPYLHVAETNAAAINLYLKSEFQIRRKISFWNIIK